MSETKPRTGVLRPWWSVPDITLGLFYPGSVRLPNTADGRERWAYWHPIEERWIAGTEIRMNSGGDAEGKKTDETEAQTKQIAGHILSFLTKRQKEVFELSVEGYAPPEIAKRLGATVNNVYVTQTHARTRIKKHGGATAFIPQEVLKRHRLHENL